LWEKLCDPLITVGEFEVKLRTISLVWMRKGYFADLA
jgi:hypothetical protein